jgi:hypothetical protein
MLQRLIAKLRALISRTCKLIQADNGPDITLLDDFGYATTVGMLEPNYDRRLVAPIRTDMWTLVRIKCKPSDKTEISQSFYFSLKFIHTAHCKSFSHDAVLPRASSGVHAPSNCLWGQQRRLGHWINNSGMVLLQELLFLEQQSTCRQAGAFL